MEMIDFSKRGKKYIQKMIQLAQPDTEIIAITSGDYYTTFMASENRLVVYDYDGNFVFERNGVLKKTENEYRFATDNEVFYITDNYVAIESGSSLIVYHESGSFVPVRNGIIQNRGENGYALYLIDKVSYDEILSTESPFHYPVDIFDSRVCGRRTQFLCDGNLYKLNINITTNSLHHWEVIREVPIFLKPLFEQIFNGSIKPCDVTIYVKLDTEDHIAVAVLDDVVVVIKSDHSLEIMPKKEFKDGNRTIYSLNEGTAIISERNRIGLSQLEGW